MMKFLIYLRRIMGILEAKFVHDPISFEAMGSSIVVEHQGFSHPQDRPGGRIKNPTIFAGGFPVPAGCRPVGPISCRIFPISKTKKIPLLRIQLRHLFIPTIHNINALYYISRFSNKKRARKGSSE